MAVASLANRIQVNTNCANNDALYGPYNSIDEAKTSIPSALLNGAGAMGRTIGLLEDSKVIEYWWQPTGDGIEFITNKSEIECERISEQDRDGYIAWTSYNHSDPIEHFYTKEGSTEVFKYNELLKEFSIVADSYQNITLYGFVKKVVVDNTLNNSSSNPIANKAVAEKFEEIEEMIGSADDTMGETFTTNMVVGGIDSGTQIKATDTIKTIIKNMLLKLKLATVKYAPYATISPTGGNVEYGTTISQIFTASLVDGKFTQYTNGGTSQQDISMGCTKTSAAFQKKVGSGSYAEYTNDSTSSFEVNEPTYIKAIVSHTASTANPTNSDGTSTLSYPEGRKEATATYTPYLGYFFKTSDTELTATRANFGTPILLTGNSASTTKAFDKKYVYVAVPSAYKVASAISANNEAQSYTMTTTTIADAGGTMRDYKVYTFAYAAALGVNVTISITKA